MSLIILLQLGPIPVLIEDGTVNLRPQRPQLPSCQNSIKSNLDSLNLPLITFNNHLKVLTTVELPLTVDFLLCL